MKPSDWHRCELWMQKPVSCPLSKLHEKRKRKSRVPVPWMPDLEEAPATGDEVSVRQGARGKAGSQITPKSLEEQIEEILEDLGVEPEDLEEPVAVPVPDEVPAPGRRERTPEPAGVGARELAPAVAYGVYELVRAGYARGPGTARLAEDATAKALRPGRRGRKSNSQ